MAKILVVDDAPTILEIESLVLGVEGHEIDTAADGFQALEKIKLNSYQVAIFDVNMPGMTGIELCAKVKQLPNGKDLRIIILTTESSQDMVNQAKKNGASAWLIKPFKEDELITVVNRLLNKW